MLVVGVVTYLLGGIVFLIALRYRADTAGLLEPNGAFEVLMLVCVYLAWPICVMWEILSKGLRIFIRVPRAIATWVVTITDAIVFRLSRGTLEETELGGLYEGTAPGGERWKMLKVTDEHGDHWIRVPPNMERVKESLAWSFDISEDDYMPDVEA